MLSPCQGLHAGLIQHHHRQHALQLLPQSAQIGLRALQLVNIGLMRHQVGARVSPTRFLAGGDAGGLPRDGGGLGLQVGQLPTHAALGLGPSVEQMPDIALVTSVRIDGLTGGAQRIAAITDGRLPAQPAILRQPQQQCPAFGIDRQGPNEQALRRGDQRDQTIEPCPQAPVEDPCKPNTKQDRGAENVDQSVDPRGAPETIESKQATNDCRHSRRGKDGTKSKYECPHQVTMHAFDPSPRSLTRRQSSFVR